MAVLRMTDDAFAELCASHPDFFFEMTAEGELITLPPTCSIQGLRNAELTKQVGNWAHSDGRGVVSASSSGFVLPNGARRSSDVAWTPSRILQLDPVEREGFWHLCPDFVIELRSPSDRIRSLRERMEEWVSNGLPSGPRPETLSKPDEVAGEGPVESFMLQLPRVWDPLA
ncbi:MAG: Uma2 family endonuclease [Acidobacteria bacterium]|nr:Uma2 family endonuclease [Acidobacteriota bacterium]